MLRRTTGKYRRKVIEEHEDEIKRLLIRNILDNMSFEELMKLGFEIEKVDPENTTDKQIKDWGVSFITRLREEDLIYFEIQIKTEQ